MVRSLLWPIALLLVCWWVPGAAHAQTDEMVDADRKYTRAKRVFVDARRRAADDPAEAREGYGEALSLLRDAQRLLRGEIHQYRYAEALSLRGDGRLSEAWVILTDLVEQSDAPEVAARASKEIAEILTELEPLDHARLDFDCGAQSTTVRITRAGGEGGADDETGRWRPCHSWPRGQLLVPGKYAVHMRRVGEGDSETTRALELTPGERRTIAVHYELAPPGDVCFQVSGGCAPAVDKMRCP